MITEDTMQDKTSENGRKSNKERAKEHRERKKQFIEELKAENKALKEEVDSLKYEIQQLRENTRSEAAPNYADSINGYCENSANEKTQLYETFTRDEQFVNESLPRLIKSNPNEIRFSTIEQARDSVGIFSTSRINLLKDAFRTFIDNILPIGLKVCVLNIDHVRSDQWETYFTNRKRAKKYDTKINENSAEFLRYLSEENPMSQTLLETWKDKGQYVMKHLKAIRRAVKKLVSTRNHIFSTLKTLQDYDLESGLFQSYQKEDLVAFDKIRKNLENTNFLKPHYLWKLGTKRAESEEYKDVDYSE